MSDAKASRFDYGLALATLWKASDGDPIDSVDVAGQGGFLTALGEVAPKERIDAVMSLAGPALPAGLERVMAGSEYLRDCALHRPKRFLSILQRSPETSLDAARDTFLSAMTSATDKSAAMRALRSYKDTAAMAIALADLSYARPVDWVIRQMSDLAEATVSASIDWLLSEAARAGRYLPPSPDQPSLDSGLVVLGMGKLGAGELNFSSDVDLIVYYEPTAPLREGLEPGPFFVRLTRDLVKLMSEITERGYVFRVDLRLRPDPGATQPAISVDAALQYYESLGQNWERAALIKARPIAGDREAGERFLQDVAPFVWRKYMDFNALTDVHAMKRQIHAHKGHDAIAVAGHNVKLGRGGIREIEFFVQTQQLVAGGRNPHLRHRETLVMLDRLTETGWITEAVRDAMADAYRFLRALEHRIQMVRDAQTHDLPSDADDLEAFSRFAGFAAAEALRDELLPRLESVQRHYERLFERSPSLTSDSGSLVFVGDTDDPETLETLGQLGFKRPAEVSATIRAWHYGRFAATRSERARERLTELVPSLLEAFGRVGDADAAFAAFDRFVRALPTGVQVFSLLCSNRHLLGLIAEIAGTAPRLAEILARRPRVLEALLEPDFLSQTIDPALLAEHLARTLAQAESHEDVLDRARIFGHEHMFLIGVQLLTGALPAKEIGKSYADLAETLVDQLHAAVRQEFAHRHGIVPGAESALLAMGKLGGRELTATSDLDMIVLYDGADGTVTSDGEKPLAASTYFLRLSQRIVASLAAPTAEGSLYEVDLRLRPSGNAGPLATSLDGFVRYQRENAWTWEHMALTRARLVSASPRIREAVSRAIRDVLTLKRDRETVRADVATMRQRIRTQKGATDPWDIKAAEGGIIDLEFIAQFLQLAYASDHPDILSPTTETALRAIASKDLLPQDLGDGLVNAAELYQSLVQVSRLALNEPFDPARASPELARLMTRTAGAQDLAEVERRLIEAERMVTRAVSELIG
ncbi:MAG: bifunctional [glutamine synthetase] adenylyltransferase/[glutamine synthetase]-adenylyl-L-tyrosine phosphorylase [Pseudomonadota bacterium]